MGSRVLDYPRLAQLRGKLNSVGVVLVDTVNVYGLDRSIVLPERSVPSIRCSGPNATIAFRLSGGGGVGGDDGGDGGGDSRDLDWHTEIKWIAWAIANQNHRRWANTPHDFKFFYMY